MMTKKESTFLSFPSELWKRRNTEKADSTITLSFISQSHLIMQFSRFISCKIFFPPHSSKPSLGFCKNKFFSFEVWMKKHEFAYELEGKLCLCLWIVSFSRHLNFMALSFRGIPASFFLFASNQSRFSFEKKNYPSKFVIFWGKKSDDL